VMALDRPAIGERARIVSRIQCVTCLSRKGGFALSSPLFPEALMTDIAATLHGPDHLATVAKPKLDSPSNRIAVI